MGLGDQEAIERVPVVGRQERCDHRLRGHRQLAQPPLCGNPPGGGGADQQRCFRAFQRLRQTLVELVWLQHGREEHMGIEQQLLPVPHPGGCIEEGQVSSGRPASRPWRRSGRCRLLGKHQPLLNAQFTLGTSLKFLGPDDVLKRQSITSRELCVSPQYIRHGHDLLDHDV